MNTFTRNTLFALFLIGIVLLMIGGILFFQQYQSLISDDDNRNTSYLTLRAANGAIGAITEATLDIDAFIESNDPTAIKNLQQIVIIAQVNLDTLNQLTDDDKYQQILIKDVTPLFNRKIAFLKKIAAQLQADDMPGLRATVAETGSVQLTQQIVKLITLIKHIEINQLNGFTSDARHMVNHSTQFFIGIGALCELLFIFSYVGLRKYTR
jgi:CHASE3 domain sensor protein